jgi:hypothetical protein
MDVFQRPGLAGNSKKCLIRSKQRPKFLSSFDFCPVLVEIDKFNPEKCSIGGYSQENLPINRISSRIEIKGSGTLNPITGFFNGIMNNSHIFHGIKKTKQYQTMKKPQKNFTDISRTFPGHFS